MKFKELFSVETAAKPAVVVIFGATGDLARRKLFPALRNLHQRELLNEETVIVACGRRDYNDESFRALLDGDEDFLKHIRYCRGDNYGDDLYAALKKIFDEVDSKNSDIAFNKLFYLALAADDMLQVCRQLSSFGLLSEEEGKGWNHVIFEKPFGHDLASARALNNSLQSLLKESQIYRIDHYLGKETVQNILMLRFANVIFEPLWRAEYIERVEITAAESLGVEKRGAYYDNAGALRDMFQNHMLQLLSLTAMEVPSSFAADAVRDEKVKLLRAVRPFDLDNLQDSVVRGQYEAYTHEPGVKEESQTETFVAAKFYIDNWRWRNVPFFLRSGKKMLCKKSEIAIIFKKIPHSIFPDATSENLANNALVLQIFPNEGITLALNAKKPGPKLHLGRMTLDFDYSSLGRSVEDDAYERLLLDALLGDPTLFIRSDFIDEAWKILTPVLEKWKQSDEKPELYYAGSEGPTGAKKLIAPAKWRKLK